MPIEIGAELRKRVVARAGNACEYCRIPQEDSGFSLQVDHVVSRKHGGSSLFDNLALSCAVCNRYKGSDIASVDAETGEIVRLFNPRNDDWPEHFEMDGAWIRPLTGSGRVTLKLLRFNTLERIEERRILQLMGRYLSR